MGPSPRVIYQSFPTYSPPQRQQSRLLCAPPKVYAREDATRVHGHAQIGITISQPMEQCLQVPEQLRSSNNGTFVSLTDPANATTAVRATVLDKYFWCSYNRYGHCVEEFLLWKLVLICTLKRCNSLRYGANDKDTMFRVHQAHLLRTLSPIGPSTRRGRAGRLGPNQLRKLGLDRLGHFRAQSALQMSGAHVLRSLIESHGGRGKIDSSLATLVDWNVRTMAAPDTHLIQQHFLVSSANPTGHIVIRRSKRFNVPAQKNLKLAQDDPVGRARQRCG
jgi:hypothetical protein